MFCRAVKFGVSQSARKSVVCWWITKKNILMLSRRGIEAKSLSKVHGEDIHELWLEWYSLDSDNVLHTRGYKNAHKSFRRLKIGVNERRITVSLRKLRVKRPIQRSGVGRPAACDLIRGNKAVDLFPRIESQAAGRSAPPRPATLYVCFYPNTRWSTHNSLLIHGVLSTLKVSCVTTAIRITGPMFSETINSRRYTTHILTCPVTTKHMHSFI